MSIWTRVCAFFLNTAYNFPDAKIASACAQKADLLGCRSLLQSKLAILGDALRSKLLSAFVLFRRWAGRATILRLLHFEEALIGIGLRELS